MKTVPHPKITPSEDQPEFILMRGLRRTSGKLSRFVSMVNKALVFFYQQSPKEATNGFNMARYELERVCQSAQQTRTNLIALLNALGADDLIEKADPMEFSLVRDPLDSIVMVRRLISGLTGCNNSTKEILAYDTTLIKKDLLDTTQGRKLLHRLAPLPDALKDFNFTNPKEVEAFIRKIQKRATPLSQSATIEPRAAKQAKPSTPKKDLDEARAPKQDPVVPLVPLKPIEEPKAQKPKTTPVDQKSAELFLDLFEDKKIHFKTELQFQIARDLMIQVADSGHGYQFISLLALYNETDKLSAYRLTNELNNMGPTLKKFGLRLVGDFMTWGIIPITFEKIA